MLNLFVVIFVWLLNSFAAPYYLPAETPQAIKPDWELVKNQKGIKVYTKVMPGYSLKAFKGTVRINTDSDACLALLQDFDSYHTWMHTCPESKLVRQVSKYEHYVYTVTDAPWPITDRDLISHCLATTDASGTITIALSCAPNEIPEKSNRIRIKKLDGYWKLTPVNATTTDVVYQAVSDSGGSVPAWAANMTMTDVPFYTLLNMKSKLEK